MTGANDDSAEGYEREESDLLRSMIPKTNQANAPSVLFHYTRAAPFKEILTRKCLWATHCRHLNDHAEHHRGLEIVREVALDIRPRPTQAFAKLLGATLQARADSPPDERFGPYIVSLSSCGNVLSQWRAYGDNGAGYSIGFSTSDLLVGPHLRSCVYEEDDFREQVAQRFREMQQPIDLFVAREGRTKEGVHVAMSLLDYNMRFLASSYKDNAFAEEKEWRLVVDGHFLPNVAPRFRAGARGLVPYMSIPLTENEASNVPLESVFVGPTQEPETGRAAARMFLETLGYSDSAKIVRDSGIPYRGS